MKIKTKILCTLLGMSFLVAFVGVLAVDRLRASAQISAVKEAENVARVLGYLLESDSDTLSASAQKVVTKLHETQGRDVVLVDAHQRVLADAVPSSIGKPFDEDPHDEIGDAMKDRQPRTFIETSVDYPAGIRQIAVPIISQSGQLLGAVVLEYTPLYNELIRLTNVSVRHLAFAGLAGVAIALLIALFIGRSISAPLQQLTEVAAAFASGRSDFPMPPPRSDEIGVLANAFQNMMEKRQQAEEELRRTRDELEVRVVARTAELATSNTALEKENAERKHAQTAQKILAAELTRERERLDDILNTVPAVVFEQWMPLAGDGAQRINFASSYVEKIYGYTREEWNATPDFWFSRVHPDDRDYVSGNAAAILSGGRYNSKEVFRWITRDDRVIWGETHLVVLKDEAGKPIGVRGVTFDVTERKRTETEIESMNKQLIDLSREAGMAEVATSVLHNVGNVLNSVNVSYSMIADKVRMSRVASVVKIAELLHEHAARLPAFFTSDPRGQKLPEFMGKLAARLSDEQSVVLNELHSLGQNIEHIKEIVAVQQSYAFVGGVRETLPIRALVEDALRMNSGALARHGVEVIREFDEVPPISVEKNKVLQILVNLVSNAKYALCDTARTDNKRLVVRITRSNSQVFISLGDNGVGISPENMTRVFAHGFTTKKDGHGFGLHSGVLAAREMGGRLTVHSDGPGAGATFTLELPIDSNRSSQDKNYAT